MYVYYCSGKRCGLAAINNAFFFFLLKKNSNAKTIIIIKKNILYQYIVVSSCFFIGRLEEYYEYTVVSLQQGFGFDILLWGLSV